MAREGAAGFVSERAAFAEKPRCMECRAIQCACREARISTNRVSAQDRGLRQSPGPCGCFLAFFHNLRPFLRKNLVMTPAGKRLHRGMAYATLTAVLIIAYR